MDPTTPLAGTDLLLRLGAAIAAGTVIGLNRDLRNRPAGVRTHALVGLSTAIAMVAAVELPLGSAQGGDISRVVQGVLTGIGFVGAGVILRQPDRRSVRGLTTAASIWLTAILGLVCGLGKWMLAATGVALALVVLLGGGPLERLIRRLMHRPDRSSDEES